MPRVEYEEALRRVGARESRRAWLGCGVPFAIIIGGVFVMGALSSLGDGNPVPVILVLLFAICLGVGVIAWKLCQRSRT